MIYLVEKLNGNGNGVIAMEMIMAKATTMAMLMEAMVNQKGRGTTCCVLSLGDSLIIIISLSHVGERDADNGMYYH